jgi:hypothetical protein
MAVDRVTKSNAAPAPVPPKGTAGTVLHARGISADRVSPCTLTSVWVLTSNSPAPDGSRPKGLPSGACSPSERGVRKRGFVWQGNEQRTVALSGSPPPVIPTATAAFPRNSVQGVVVRWLPAGRGTTAGPHPPRVGPAACLRSGGTTPDPAGGAGYCPPSPAGSVPCRGAPVPGSEIDSPRSSSVRRTLPGTALLSAIWGN